MFEIKVDIIENIKRPYADAVLKYKITVEGEPPSYVDKMILDFCTKSLTHCDKREDDDRAFYEPYYNIKKENNNTYIFKIVSPFLD